jgi:WD40 repeat protein
MKKRIALSILPLTLLLVAISETKAMESSLKKSMEKTLAAITMPSNRNPVSRIKSLQEKNPNDIILTAVEPNGPRTATLDKDGVVEIWNTEQGTLLMTLSDTYKINKIQGLYFPQDEKNVISMVFPESTITVGIGRRTS